MNDLMEEKDKKKEKIKKRIYFIRETIILSYVEI